ncbi:MAG TPA: hypothetical protein VIZ68_00785 [Thermoplasmata archaeon]
MSAAERRPAPRSDAPKVSTGRPALEPDGDPSLGGPREILAAVVHRILHPRPLVLETRRPVEVPVLTETKRRWGRGDRAGAVRYGYESVLVDLQRGFAVEFPPDWTHEDILERGVTPEMESIPEFLGRLVRVYERVRYGPAVPRDLPSPEPLLQSIYAHPRMWGLYIAEVPRAEVGAMPGNDPTESPDPAAIALGREP